MPASADVAFPSGPSSGSSPLSEKESVSLGSATSGLFFAIVLAASNNLTLVL